MFLQPMMTIGIVGSFGNGLGKLDALFDGLVLAVGICALKDAGR